MREEQLVSYLPLSHVAAQMNDIWISMRFAATTSFAQPDALKVTGLFIQSFLNNIILERKLQQMIISPAGLFGGDSTGSASYKFSGRTARVGEDAGENEGTRFQVHRFTKTSG